MSNDSSTDQDRHAPNATAMSPTKRRQLQQCFERAQDLANRAKSDFDYAHDLYSQCVINDPGNLVYVEALLDNLQRKYKHRKKRGRLLGFGGRKTFNAAVAEENWFEIFREGMNLLRSNPWDVPTLRALAQACALHRYNEVELRYLKNALDSKPKDAEVNRHCAQSLARMGQFDMAIACWSRVAEATKSSEPDKFISELTLAKTMGVPASAEALGQTGPRPTTPLPAAANDEADAKTDGEKETSDQENEAEDEPREPRREIKLNTRQKLERAIRDDPSQTQNYLRLAELHSSERRLQDAERVLGKAMEAVGASLELQMALEDARMRSAKARVSIAERRAANAKTEEADELVVKLREDLNRLELDVYNQRCQRFPENRRVHYELGLRLRRAGNYLEAVKSYDEARRDPQCLVAATLEMGECWQRLKQYAKALKYYQLAIEKSSDLDGDRRKLALYRGAVLAMALNKTAAAVRWFTELLTMDPHFKDAATHLDKIKSIGQDR